MIEELQLTVEELYHKLDAITSAPIPASDHDSSLLEQQYRLLQLVSLYFLHPISCLFLTFLLPAKCRIGRRVARSARSVRATSAGVSENRPTEGQSTGGHESKEPCSY